LPNQDVKFQFDGITLAGAGSGPPSGVLQRKTVEQNQAVIVTIDAAKNAAIAGQFTGDEGEEEAWAKNSC
jgi:hypothetical protein